MTHARQQVLAAVKEIIEGDLSLKVVPRRNVERMDSPCGLLSWRSETIETVKVMGGPLLQNRTLTVALVLRVKDGADSDDQLEDLAGLVEAKLQQERLGDLVSAWRLVTVDREIDATGEQTVLQDTLTYTATYRTRASDPQTIIK